MIEIIPNWHPVFVHFTVALLSVAVLLSVLVRFMSAGQLREQWQWVAQWNLWLGAGITLLTVAAGFLAYNSVAHDAPSHQAMTEHRNWALVTAALFIALAIWSWLRVRSNKPSSAVLLAGLLVGGVLLASTAWHGGEVVYRYGLGVMSLPKADSHGRTGGGHVDAGGSEHGHADAMSPSDDHHGEAAGKDERSHNNNDAHAH